MKDKLYSPTSAHLSRFAPLCITVAMQVLPLSLAPIVATARNFDASALDADQFSLGMVGFAGGISGAEKEMAKILERPDADDFFLSVINDDNRSTVAKLYALCGLKKGKSTAFGYAFEKIQAMNSSVSVMHGDVMKKESAGDLAVQVKNGRC
ncbi:hypothetical protein RA224_08330 [Achromobacter aegrifaciens]|uniref:hypothetical protein n=1 Tax=Achromobacter aegrifaciens TaxID=1287736 RepID=UPI0027BB0EAC|nr:hypothetical protein [Achromobacter aegrifaciens]WLW63415.1 hypothetical protein RA224_08330 [Achromobacter aegrifaciens]